MNWKINKVETDVNNQKNITRVFFTVYTGDENKVGFSGDAILSEPNDGTYVDSNSSEEDILKVLFYSLGENAVCFYEKSAKASTV